MYVPVLLPSLKPYYTQPWPPAAHDSQLFSNGRFFFLRRIDEEDEVGWRVIDLEKSTDNPAQPKTTRKYEKFAGGRVMKFFQDGPVEW